MSASCRPAPPPRALTHRRAVPSECLSRRRAFCGEHERERVKRPRPPDTRLILKAETVLCRDELVAHGDRVAAGAAQPGRIPGVEYLALLEPQQALPRFRNAVRVDPRRA